MFLSLISAVPSFVKKADEKIGDYWWVLLAAAIVLLIILFMVISAKNKRIRKLKRELKNTRTELEIEKSRAKNEEMFAPVTGSKEIFGEKANDTLEEEIDQPDEPEPEPKRKKSGNESESDKITRKIVYYNRITQVRPSSGGNVKFTVKYDRAKDSWVIVKDDSTRAFRRFDTKEEALTKARELCKQYDASLVVHKKDGKFQKQ